MQVKNYLNKKDKIKKLKAIQKDFTGLMVLYANNQITDTEIYEYIDVVMQPFKTRNKIRGLKWRHIKQ